MPRRTRRKHSPAFKAKLATSKPQTSFRLIFLTVLKRAVVMALVWLALTGAAPEATTHGVVSVVAATALSLLLLPAGPRPALVFSLFTMLPGFLIRSVLGGVDVAGRALHPRLPVKPGWVSVKTRMQDGVARSLFGAETSLLPGTLSAGCDEAGLLVHCLDSNERTRKRLGVEEVRVARAFSQSERGVGQT